jgi:hypothetical protein
MMRIMIMAAPFD